MKLPNECFHVKKENVSKTSSEIVSASEGKWKVQKQSIVWRKLWLDRVRLLLCVI